MGKLILEFDLSEPEEVSRSKIAAHANDYHGVVWDLRHNFAGRVKRGEWSVAEILTEIQDLIEDVPTFD